MSENVKEANVFTASDSMYGSESNETEENVFRAAERRFKGCSSVEEALTMGVIDFDSIKVFSANSQDFVKLQRWLTNIPLNERIEKNLIYHISR